MFRVFLQKDLRRVLRNPWPWVLNVALPLAITGLMGLAFGGGGKEGATVARIRVAIVDEDKSVIGSLFKGAFNQGEAAKRMEAVIVETRDEALSLLRNDKISAAVILPAEFTKNYAAGHTNLALEIIKNPAQKFYPAIVEELVAVAVSGLNALSRNFQSEFPRIQEMLTNKFDLVTLAAVLGHIGTRLNEAQPYVSPPLVTFTAAEINNRSKGDGAPGMGVFAFILPGMASAFLLFMADHSLRDINRERRLRTLDRMITVRGGTGTFVAAKIVFAALTVLLGSIILFGVSALIFRIQWLRPGLMALACAAYALFAAGFLAALVALVRNDRRSEVLNNMLLFAVAFAGGSYIPPSNFPDSMRKYLCPLMPNYWFAEALRSLQDGAAGVSGPLLVVVKLGLVGVILGVLAAWLIQRRLSAGARA